VYFGAKHFCAERMERMILRERERIIKKYIYINTTTYYALPLSITLKVKRHSFHWKEFGKKERINRKLCIYAFFPTERMSPGRKE
jgi:hypothetical protein